MCFLSFYMNIQHTHTHTEIFSVYWQFIRPYLFDDDDVATGQGPANIQYCTLNDLFTPFKINEKAKEH